MKFGGITFFSILQENQDSPIWFQDGQSDVSFGEVPSNMETVDGRECFVVLIRRRTVPSDIIENKVRMIVSEMERSTGSKPTAKERKELKRNLKSDLLKVAFPRDTLVPVVRDGDRLYVFNTSSGNVDCVLSAMTRRFALAPASFQISSEKLTQIFWQGVGDFMPSGSYKFELDGVMAATKSSAFSTQEQERLVNHLPIKEIGLYHADNDDSFTLTRELQIKGLKINQVVSEEKTDWHIASEVAAIIYESLEAA